MWLTLKDVVNQEAKDYKNLSQGDDPYYKGREDEANDILDEIDIVENMVRKYF
jgi:hypothetical protein